MGRTLMLAATSLQIAWLAAAALSGATPDPRLPIALIVYSVIVTACCWLLVPEDARAFAPSALDSLFERGTGGVWWLAAIAAIGSLIYVLAPNRTFSDETQIAQIAQFIDERGVRRFFGQYAAFTWLGTRHPPLMVLAYAMAWKLTGGGLFALRALNAVCAVALVVAAYALGATLYTRVTSGLAVMILLMTPYFFRLSGVAMLDMPLALTFTCSLLIVARHLKTRDNAHAPDGGADWWWTVLGLGAVVGGGLLVKYEMLLVFPCVVVWLLLRRRVYESTAFMLAAGGVSMGILAGWAAVAWKLGILGAQAHGISSAAAFGTTTSATTSRWVLEAVLTRIPSALGVYLLPVIGVGMFRLAARRSIADLSVLGAIAAVVIPILMTMPDPRYLFPVFPLIALAAAEGVLVVPERDATRLVLLLTCHALGALVLFWGWQRQALLLVDPFTHGG